MKRFISILPVLFILAGLFINPSLSYGGCAGANQTKKLFQAITEKNFKLWCTLCSEIKSDLDDLKRSPPKHDVREREREFLKRPYKGFSDSYHTVYLFENPEHILVSRLRQRTLDDVPDKDASGAFMGVPMLFEKFKPSWKIVEVGKTWEVSDADKANTVYVQLSLPDKGPIGIVSIKWDEKCLVSAGEGYLLAGAIKFYKIHPNWPIIPADQLIK